MPDIDSRSIIKYAPIVIPIIFIIGLLFYMWYEGYIDMFINSLFAGMNNIDFTGLGGLK